MPRALPLLSLALLVAVAPRAARATYSIVAADSATRTTGGAGTSCLEGQDVYIIYGSVPGVGNLHVQAQYNAEALSRGTARMAAGFTPDEIVQDLTQPDFDANASSRQYGVADVLGRTATFTGKDTLPYAGDRRGAVGAFVYAAQGNILTSRAVIDQAGDAFEASGCDLAERLMDALEAGADHGEGDRRCTETRGIPSDSAFIRVNGPSTLEGDTLLDLHVPTSGDENPLVPLRAAFDAWRADHPCANGSPAAESAGAVAEDHGCGCDLPRGRTSARMTFWLLAVALWLARRGRARGPLRAI